jgi:hypothetical protein
MGDLKKAVREFQASIRQASSVLVDVDQTASGSINFRAAIDIELPEAPGTAEKLSPYNLADSLKKVAKQLRAVERQADKAVGDAGGTVYGTGWGHLALNESKTGLRIFGMSEYSFYKEGADIEAAVSSLSRLGRRANLKRYSVDIDSYM